MSKGKDVGLLSFVPVHQGHIGTVLPALSARSKMELDHATQGRCTEAEAIREAVELSGKHAYAILEDGIAIALAGAHPTGVPGEVACWFMFTDRFFAVGVQPSILVHAAMHRSLDEAGVRRMVAHSWLADRRVTKWFLHMGFAVAAEQTDNPALTIFEIVRRPQAQEIPHVQE